MAAKSKLTWKIEEWIVARARAGAKHAAIARELAKRGTKITPQAVGQFLGKHARATGATTRARVREATSRSAIDGVDALNRNAEFGARVLLPKLRKAIRLLDGAELLGNRAVAEVYAKFCEIVRKDVELLAKLSGADGPDPNSVRFGGLDEVLLALRRAPEPSPAT